MTNQPIIWKYEKTKLGDPCKCHEWSLPFSTPGGLVKECRLCGLTKFITIE